MDLKTYLQGRGLEVFPNTRYLDIYEYNDRIYSQAFFVDWEVAPNTIARTQIRDKDGWHNLIVNTVNNQIYNLMDTYFKPIIFFTESVFDAQSIIQSIDSKYKDIATAIAFGTASVYSNQLLFAKYQFKNKKIITAMDNDKAGIEATKRIIKSLDNNSKVSSLVYPYGDPNLSLVKNKNNFQVLVNQEIFKNI